MSDKINGRKQNHQVNPDEELLREYVKMQMMVYNYRLFIFNYAMKIKQPELPNIDTIREAYEGLNGLYNQFKDMVVGGNFAVELEDYLIEKSDYMRNEIVDIMNKLAKAKGYELN
jgi:hypothetical protein